MFTQSNIAIKMLLLVLRNSDGNKKIRVRDDCPNSDFECELLEQRVNGKRQGAD